MTAIVAIKPRANQARTPRTGIAAALAEFDAHLDDLKRCIHWLCGEGVAVLEIEMRRDRAHPQITVAASPRLYIVCKDDCANVGRRNDGMFTRFLWITQRHGCQIVWEEVTCA